MGDVKKHKSPDELGEAVGQKIDELFGGLFEDDTTQVTSDDIPMVSTTVTRVEHETSSLPPEQQPTPKPEVFRVDTPEPDSPEAFLDQLEALILDLEWEMNYKTIQELAKNFNNLLKKLPSIGSAKTAFEMSQKVLERFSDPGSSPHPLLVKLLHDSVAVIRDTISSKIPGETNQALMANLAGTYKQIMSTRKETFPVEPAPQHLSQGPSIGDVLRDVEPVVSSLEQLSRRLTKTLDVWRDAGEISVDDITLRLGKLDSLLSEKIGFLSQTLKKIEQSGQGKGGGIAAGLHLPDMHKFPDGLLLIAWYSKPLAIPSTLISALIPVAKGQAEQLLGKKKIALGNLELSKLPLSKPKTARNKPDPIPSWLVHVSIKGREFFVLADSALGFRRIPQGLDPTLESRVKIGNVSYTVLSPERVHIKSS